MIYLIVAVVIFVLFYLFALSLPFYFSWSSWNCDDNYFHFLFSPIQCLLDKRRERRIELEMARLKKEFEALEINTNNNIYGIDINYYSYDDSGYFW